MVLLKTFAVELIIVISIYALINSMLSVEDDVISQNSSSRTNTKKETVIIIYQIVN